MGLLVASPSDFSVHEMVAGLRTAEAFGANFEAVVKSVGVINGIG